MYIQFQLAQQCIQISTRINSSSVHTYIFVCFIRNSLRVILQGFVDPKCNSFGRQIVSPCCLTVVDDCATSRTWSHNAKTFYSYAKKRLHQNLNLNLKSKDTVPFLIISLVSDVLIVYLLRTFESYHIWKKRIHLLNTRSKIKSIRLRNAAL